VPNPWQRLRKTPGLGRVADWYAWVGAGKVSARDDRGVAEMARSRRHGH
jgi:hypothetical protein